MSKVRRPNLNKRWDFSRWVQWVRVEHPASKANRKRRGTKKGKHK